jgi:hypothetical protein
VALKISSTVYRFARYYSGAVPYVRKGPPAPLLRALGPFVIVTSLAVLGTGVALAVTGPGRGSWLLFHKASFVLWFGVMAIHVLACAGGCRASCSAIRRERHGYGCAGSPPGGCWSALPFWAAWSSPC